LIDMMPLISYKSRMAKLWQRSNGIYYAVWEQNRKTRRKSLKTKDHRKAATKLRNFNRDLMAGKVKPISEGFHLTFYDFCQEFLEHIDGLIRPTTSKQYETALSKAKSTWGNIPLSHITIRHIDNVIKDMAKAGLKPPTINKNLRGIKVALSKAYQWEYLKSPVRFPKMLPEEKALRFLSVDQLRALIGKIDEQEFADYCLFSAYTGLRSGEILRLKWSDIDNPEGHLRISPVQKNKHESRIPINANARAILERCRGRENGTRIFRFVCLTWISQKFKSVAIASNLGDARFHDLRHTFGSHMAMAGVDLKSIQKLMRHETISSTMIYADVSPEHLRESSERLNYGPMPVVLNAQKPTKNRPPWNK